MKIFLIVLAVLVVCYLVVGIIGTLHTLYDGYKNPWKYHKFSPKNEIGFLWCWPFYIGYLFTASIYYFLFGKRIERKRKIERNKLITADYDRFKNRLYVLPVGEDLEISLPGFDFVLFHRHSEDEWVLGMGNGVGKDTTYTYKNHSMHSVMDTFRLYEAGELKREELCSFLEILSTTLASKEVL